MSLFDRLGRVIKGNLNDLISKAEDPEKILEQAVLEMQDNAVKMRQALATAIATQKKTAHASGNLRRFNTRSFDR